MDRLQSSGVSFKMRQGVQRAADVHDMNSVTANEVVTPRRGVPLDRQDTQMLIQSGALEALWSKPGILQALPKRARAWVGVSLGSLRGLPVPPHMLLRLDAIVVDSITSLAERQNRLAGSLLSEKKGGLTVIQSMFSSEWKFLST